MCCPLYTELVPVMINSTKPFASILLMTLVWSIMAVIGSVLLPGAMVISKIVEFPTTPAEAVARESVTLPYINVSLSR
jgi:ABC-type sugar transport system permease subunit